MLLRSEPHAHAPPLPIRIPQHDYTSEQAFLHEISPPAAEDRRQKKALGLSESDPYNSAVTALRDFSRSETPGLHFKAGRPPLRQSLRMQITDQHRFGRMPHRSDWLISSPIGPSSLLEFTYSR